ncbi:MAG: hypothetical protein QM844_08875 [Planctomycetota bacterium]|nr:hypothetical protein [Planctomycetota bacterium]
MRVFGRLPVVRAAIIVAVCLLAGSLSSPAADPPAVRFLEALREREYYDVALDYLQAMRQSDRCPDELKETIDYQIGMTLLDAANAIEAPAERETKLDEATVATQKFLKEHPAHELAVDASTRIGEVLFLRGVIRAHAAEQPGVAPAEKSTRLAEARKFYDEARTAIQAAENLSYQKAKELKERAGREPSSRVKSELDRAYIEVLKTRLLLANIADQQARANAAGSKEFKEQLAEAAKQYAELAEKYSNMVGGAQARMYEGRAYKDLGENQKAIDIFLEMLVLPDQPLGFRKLKLLSLAHLLETYLKPEVKKYEEAWQQAEQWKSSALAQELSGPEGRQIHLLGGRAAIAAAKALEPNDARRREFVRSARRSFEFVLRFAGATRNEASALLADDLFGGQAAEVAEPATFQEAVEQANLAWVKLITSAREGAEETDAAKSAEQFQAAQADLMRLCQLALAMARPDAPVADLNTIRFRMTYLYFLSGDLYQAAVLGEFLAYRYPTSFGARKGAEIAIKAYRKMFDTERRASRDTTFELERMRRLADYIGARWKGEPEADEAWLMMLDTAIDSGDIAKAGEYLDRLGPDSDRRAPAELRLGQALWSQYLRQAAVEENRPSQAELDKLVEGAQATLQQGIDRMRKAVDAGGAVEYPLVFSVLALSQILIDAGRAEEAVGWLNDPKIGPLSLVAAKAPVVAGRADFQIDTYKAALRAYVGAQQLDEAEKTMNLLEAAASGDGGGDGARRLTQIYIALGRQLEDLLVRLRNEGKNEQVQKVSQGFELFLDRIASREEGNSFNSLNWVAETLFSLGAGLDPGDGAAPQEARDYYTKAGATFYRILKSRPEQMPEGAETSVKVRLAACLRAMGKHKESLALLVGALKERETRVDVQMEAARTLQDWARADEKPELYLSAIVGEQVDGRYLVWGWNGIANRVVSREEYRPIFHEARYNIALCRTRLAQVKTGGERAELLKQAELDITRTYQLYPKMGGPEWFEKYDALLKAIRKFRNQPNPKGLRDA